MNSHDLKCWPDPFEAVRTGHKMFEFRLNDRDYMVGDVLILNEWKPTTEEFTGRVEVREVTYIARGPAFGIPNGYCVMSLKRCA